MKPLEQALNDYVSVRGSFQDSDFRHPQLFGALLCFSSRGHLAHHRGTGSSLGLTTCEGPTFDLDRASGHGPTLRHLVQRHRTSHRDSTGGPSFLILTGASLLTSSRRRDRKAAFAKPDSSPLPRDFAPTPLRLSSVC